MNCGQLTMFKNVFTGNRFNHLIHIGEPLPIVNIDSIVCKNSRSRCLSVVNAQVVSIKRSQFHSNAGGGIVISGNTRVRIENVLFMNNFAQLEAA